MEKFSLTSENLELRKRIAELESEVASFRAGQQPDREPQASSSTALSPDDDLLKPKLNLDEFKRYGRQMIMSEIGLEGQLQLKKSKVLLIGAGGLGCPAGAYLAGAGVGTIGIIDHDTVELSNLHRQILHTTSGIGQPKVQSAITRLREMNPTIRYIAYEHALTPANALDVLDQYDLVFDCTDLPSTRYLISDVCVQLGKTLVSASALRSDGQLVVLNDPPGEGPCYRCVFPTPPPPETVLTCGEGGVLGPVVGVMGVLMATEGIKIIAGRAKKRTRKRPVEETPDTAESLPKKVFTMLIYSAFSPTPFRSIKMLGKRKTCLACSPIRTITRKSIEDGSLDYAAFCGLKVAGRYPTLADDERIDVQEYHSLRETGQGGHLLDLRDKTQFDMCALGGTNVPMPNILTLPTSKDELSGLPSWIPKDDQPIYFICKLGNDSRIAVDRLKKSGFVDGRVVKDVRGGLWEWARKVDKDFPVY